MRNPFLAEGMARWAANPDMESAGRIQSWLSFLREQYRYRDVLLVDDGGRMISDPDPRRETVHVEMADAVSIARQDRKAVITDLHAGPGDRPHLEVVAPLFVPGNGKQTYVGAIIFQIDARQFLYPLIQSWPVPSRTAETLLVRRGST